MKPQLYTYFRSSAAYRVRIALALKGVEYEAVPVHLLRGEQRSSDFLALNPQGLVPVWVESSVEGMRVIPQSWAILEYLEEAYPQVPLLPAELGARAGVRAMALSLVCDVHPLCNPRVATELTARLGASEEAILAWRQHWIGQGLAAVEAQLAHTEQGDFCWGNRLTLADVCLVPQVYAAERFGCGLGAYPRIQAIASRCLAHPAFIAAAPAQQADAL